MFVAFIGVAVVALGGAIALLVWISSMTPIQATDETEPAGSPPTAQEWVDEGAVLFAIGEVEAVYGPEWSTSDQSRPSTPWGVSDVPNDTWIHTPILVELDGEPVVLNTNTGSEMETGLPTIDLVLALRGGEIDNDRYEIIDGQDREFEPGDRVGLVLSVKDEDLEDPELIDTSFGEGWEFMGRYHIDGDTALIQWGEETGEYDLEELLEEFRDAAQ
jgi:hypothetical protein